MPRLAALVLSTSILFVAGARAQKTLSAPGSLLLFALLIRPQPRRSRGTAAAANEVLTHWLTRGDTV